MKKKHPFIPLASALLLTTSLTSSGDPYRYIGTGSATAPTTGTWNVDTNWLDGTAPVSSLDNVLLFGGSGSDSYNSDNNLGEFNLNRIIFDSTSTGTVNVRNGTLNFLANSSSEGPRITQHGSGNANFTHPIKLTDTLTFDGTGDGMVSFGNSALTGGGGVIKTSSGTLRYTGSGNNTYTGLTTVSNGVLELSKNANITAITGDVLIDGGTVRLLASSQIADAATVTVTDGGTFAFNGNFNDTISSFSISSSSALAPAVLDFGEGNGSLNIGTGELTFGANTRIDGTGLGTLRRIGGNLVINFDGGQISGGTIRAGLGDEGTVLNITQGLGGGQILLGNTGTIDRSTAINLNHTGSIDLGATMIAQSTNSTNTKNALAIHIANTATGLSGGTITTVPIADADHPLDPVRIWNPAINTLTFEAGGTGFNLSGGVLDIRSTSTDLAAGVITTNGNNLTISGGALIGHRLNASSGAITLSSGVLSLTDVRSATAVHYAISTSDGNDGHTIKMLSGDTGAFAVSNGGAGVSRITIGTLDDFGTWDRGVVTAGRNYTITADTAGNSAMNGIAIFTIADNAGLVGLDLGSAELPSQLYLGNNSSFFVANSTAGAHTFNVGTDFTSNEVVVTETGSFAFGVFNSANNAQTINLHRDKGAADIALLANGNSVDNSVHIMTDQSGSGTLYVNAANLVLEEGITFGGTGAISTDPNPGNGLDESIVGSNQVVAHNAPGRITRFTIKGAMVGDNQIYLNQDIGHRLGAITLEETATIGGTQSWTTSGYVNSHALIFENKMVDATRWTGDVSFAFAGSAGEFETSTSTATPGASESFKFSSLTFGAGSTSTQGSIQLANYVQNDGGSGKEALYTSALDFRSAYTDSSNGRHTFNLNGQDLYVDRFENVTGAGSKGLVLLNDAFESVSRFQAVQTPGDTLVVGSFSVLNEATLEVVGGDYNSVVFNRNTGTIASDNAAAPNSGPNPQYTQLKMTQTWDGSSAAIGTFTFFLGSGTEAGTNTASTFHGTNGTFRLMGGDFSTSGYILNPIGTVGLLDTTGEGDAILNDVLIRGNTANDTNGVGNSTALPAFVVAGTTTVVGHLKLEDAEGAYAQATLRVGGVTASTTPVASGTAELNVVGNLSVGATNNLAIQSNATVKVGGDVDIQGVGVNVEKNVTGLGVGIHADSRFILNGGDTVQGVSIVPTVGHFHVGDGISGVLSGTAAQARLDADLSTATAAINGPASGLNLNGHTLTVSNGAGTLLIGGTLSGSGTLAGSAYFLAGANHSIGNSPGIQTITDGVYYEAGSFFNWELEANTASLTLQTGTPEFDQLTVNGLLNIGAGAQINLTLNGAGSTVNFTDAFWSTEQSWLVAESGGLSGHWNLGLISLDSDGNAYTPYGYFDLSGDGANVYLNWTVAETIPEPASALLVGLGLAGFWFVRRRKA